MTTIGNEWEIIQRNLQFKLRGAFLWWWCWMMKMMGMHWNCCRIMHSWYESIGADSCDCWRSWPISGVRLLSQLSSFAPCVSQTSLVRGAVFRLRLGPAGPLGPHTCSWTASSWELQRLMSRWLPVSRESHAQVQRSRLRAQNWRTMRTRSCDCHYSSSRKHLDNHINYQCH